MPTADAFEWPQGQPLFETMWRSVTESLAGNGIVSNGDLEVTATANALEIQVAAGSYFSVATEHTLGSSETHTLTAGDGSNDRWDTVWFDTGTGASGVTEGTAGPDPEPPDVTGDQEPLAFVYVAQNASDVTDAEILNWRAKFSNEADNVQYADSTGQYSVDNVAAALDELQEAAQISAHPLDFASDTEASAYPLANSDLDNSSVTVNAGTGLTTSSASISLGGGTTLNVNDGVVDLDFVRDADNTITGTLATLGTNPGSFGAIVDAAIDGNSASGTVHEYELMLGGVGLVTVTTESDGAGGTQNSRVEMTAPILHLAQSATPNYAAQGAGFYDTDDETPKYADSSNAYQRPLSRLDLEKVNADESGTVSSASSGPIWTRRIADGETLEIRRGYLVIPDGTAMPSGVDLSIITTDGSGNAIFETALISGDGSTIFDDETGTPLGSYANTSGASKNAMVIVDNGDVNSSGTGASQDFLAGVVGEVV